MTAVPWIIALVWAGIALWARAAIVDARRRADYFSHSRDFWLSQYKESVERNARQRDICEELADKAERERRQRVDMEVTLDRTNHDYASLWWQHRTSDEIIEHLVTSIQEDAQ